MINYKAHTPKLKKRPNENRDTFDEDVIERAPASLKICTLLDKYERREAEVKLDYVGFHIPNGFVYGYGLELV